MPTTPQETIRLHRFRDSVAFHFDSTETLYLDAPTALEFSHRLREFAEDIEAVPFSQSELETCNIDRQ